MKNWWATSVATVFSLILGAVPALAREVTLKVNLPADWSSENPTPVGFSIDGTAGVWMRTESARKCLRLEVDIDALKAELVTTQEIVRTSDARIVLLTEQVTLTEQELDTWKVKWTNTNAQLVSAEDDLTVWWRKPWVWFAVGVVAGGAATAKIVQVTN